MIFYQNTPFLNNVNFFESLYSYKVGYFAGIKNASSFFLLRLFLGAVNFPLKNMIRVFREILGWFWIFVWIFMLILTHNSISFGFTYVILHTRTVSHIDFTWMIWVFLFRKKKLPGFLCFPSNSKIILLFGENLQFL